MSASKISVHLVTLDGGDLFRDCLNSLSSQTWQDFSLIVVDNGSSDSTVEMARQFAREHPETPTQVMEAGRNLGFSAGHNRALAASASPYCVFLNQDVLLEREFLARAISFLEANPEFSSVSPKVLRLRDGKKTSVVDSLGMTFRKTLQAVDLRAGQDAATLSLPEEFEVFGPSGAAATHRRAALDEAAYLREDGSREWLDEEFFMYKDDVDLSMRLQILGWRAACVSAAECYHVRTARDAVPGKVWYKVARNRRSKSQFVNFLSYRNQWLIYFKDMPSHIIYRYLPLVAYYDLKKVTFLLIFERKTLGALREAWQKKKEMLKKRQQLFSRQKVGWKELREKMFLDA